MLNINFYRRDSDGSIFMRCFPLTNQCLTWYIRESFDLSQWDKHKQRLNRKHKQHRILNSTLDVYSDFLIQCIREDRLKNNNTTIANLKKRLNIRAGFLPEDTIYSFATNYINAEEASNRISKATAKKYRGNFNKLKESYPNLKFSEITESWVKQFISKSKKTSKDSTIAKKLKVYKYLIKVAYSRGLHSNTIFQSRVMNMKYDENTNAIYLTTAQIEKLYHHPFKEERHRNAVNLFVRGCLTGQRYSDFDKTGPDSVKEVDGVRLILVSSQQKGKKQVWIPIHTIVEQILQKDVRIISNAKLNLYIKEAAKLAGFTNYQSITTHTARRSLATNLLLAGVDRSRIKLITGHSSDTAFNKYIRIDSLNSALLMSKHEYFNEPFKGLRVV